MIEVIERHEYKEPEYFVRCRRCKSILKFAESDTVYDVDDGYRGSYCLECPVCGLLNYLGLKSDWCIETEKLKGEL